MAALEVIIARIRSQLFITLGQVWTSALSQGRSTYAYYN